MKAVDKEKLWKSYGQNRSQEIREKLIVEYAPLVSCNVISDIELIE